MSTQPKALRLAEAVEMNHFFSRKSVAEELRRLHEVNTELLKALQAVPLTDEQIQQYADSRAFYGSSNTEYREGIVEGAKWARKQLTTPPAQPAEWVGLTDEEVMAEAAQEEQAHGFIQGVRWADAKLREKNGGGA